MFQNSAVIDVNSIPNGMSASDLINIHKMNKPILTDMASASASITNSIADTVFENLGDILALEIINSKQYFKLKSMLHSSDFETARMAREIIYKNLQGR
jgi:hypothetical protein